MNTVLAHGCFDLLHLGHIRHLQAARAMGDRLVVSITDDEYVNKGHGRPIFNSAQRAQALLALSCVDEVFVSSASDAVHAIERFRPAVYVKGKDYTSKETDAGLIRERAAVEAVGGKLVFTETEKFSSSRLINSEKFSVEVLQHLEEIRPHRDEIMRAFDAADAKKIAFIGECIIDDYHYVRGLGRASKELMLATVDQGHESFEGGVVAASKHCEWRNVEVVSVANHITKRRLVDVDFNRKLFDIYSSQKIELPDPIRTTFKKRLEQALGSCDAAVVLDFGHGLLDDADRSFISNHSTFAAINSQTNAGNYGFNPVTKYSSANFVCVDFPEAKLATGLDDAPVEQVTLSLARSIFADCFLVTRGRFGSYFHDCHGGGTGHSPPFIIGGIDTIGAGDATLATVAPLLAAGLNLKYAAFVGNVAGAIKTSIVGHRRHVNRNDVIKTVEALLA